MSMDRASVYHCNICGKTFRKFLIFEGHFTFNLKCRVWNGLFMQCYVCNLKFRHLAELKYHLQGHKNVIQAASSKVFNLTHKNQHKQCKEELSRRKVTKSIQRNGNSSSEESLKHQGEHFNTIATSSFKVKKNASKKRKVQREAPLRRWRCHICKKICYTKGQLEIHVRLHTHGTYKCEICKIRFTKKSLNDHIRKYHPELVDTNNHHCTICNRHFKSKSNMNSHMNVHVSGTFKCKICHIRFTKNALTTHYKLSHPELLKDSLFAQNEEYEQSADLSFEQITKVKCESSRNEEQNVDERNIATKSYRCKICKIFCAGKERLEQHKKHHRGTHKCKVCNIRFTKHTLWRHVKQAHPTYQKEIKILKLPCSICQLTCPTQQRLDQHMKVHTNGEYQCTICRIPFTRFALVIHRALFHSELKRDTQISMEMEEKKVFSEKNTHYCDICGKSFRRSYFLQLHMESHRATTNLVKSLNLVCYVCNNDFRTLNKLKTHMEKHKIYQQWVDPVNIHLTNWSPEKAQEILHNQPLVLVENLDVNSVKLEPLANLEEQRDYRTVESIKNDNRPLIDFSNVENEVDIVVRGRKRFSITHLQREILSEIEKADKFENYKDIEPPILCGQSCTTSRVKPEFNVEQDISFNRADNDIEDCAKDENRLQISDERQGPSPIYADCNIEANIKDNVEDDLISILEMSDNEELVELPISEQQVDSTTLYDEDNIQGDVIDITSDSDDDVQAVDDTSELFYCYFCNGVFRSLNELGIHVNVCPQSMI